ncbi:uncharacterized protein LOC125498562 [Beta vulgaris subsp. vulgaris]|uniref:uncharacterized protein LOC125498562 n=1 Tax=Beta vulgaris subsp. vulgaris TaxID=3555 RepID=UPI0020367C74|nr:uncharacterized protein LOC125498562 [Beta vulgaris subsp. vulgaris]
MEQSSCFKEALLSFKSLSANPISYENIMNAAGSPEVPDAPSDGGVSLLDLIVPQFAPASVVLDELPQVKQDIVELTKSCLIGKMLSSVVDTRTIISRTKADWKFIKGEVEYLEMGNGWLMLKISNPGDLSLVWSERPWHVHGDIFVIYPWRPSFDPYLEEIKWVDLWIRIPRLLTELLNFDYVASFLSLLRHKIRFARACVRVDIKSPLLEFAEVCRHGDLVQGYVIWYEDFSSGCSFCGSDDHIIDCCPLLTSPKKEMKVRLMKNPTHNYLYDNLGKAGQANLDTTAEQAYVVQAQAKHVANAAMGKMAKKVVPPKKRYNPVRSSFSKKTNVFHERIDDSNPLVGIPENVALKSSHGIVIKEPSEVPRSAGKASEVGLVPPAVAEKKMRTDAMLDKGKGKLIIASPHS